MMVGNGLLGVDQMESKMIPGGIQTQNGQTGEGFYQNKADMMYIQ